MYWTIAARVVDLPHPVVPVQRTSPRSSKAIFSITLGRWRSSKVLTPTGTSRITIPIVPRCWNTFTRNRPSPGTP